MSNTDDFDQGKQWLDNITLRCIPIEFGENQWVMADISFRKVTIFTRTNVSWANVIHHRLHSVKGLLTPKVFSVEDCLQSKVIL